jgi:catechol-2,3-dioxygenase
MGNTVKIKLRTIVLDCTDANELSDFYSKFLGWEKTIIEPDWVLMRDPSCGTGLSFQSEQLYRKPKWPEEPEYQQKMIHIDFFVEDLETATKHALECGATLAPTQFLDGVRVFFDPAGHP